MDKEQAIKLILQDACDRDWKDETLYQTAVIAANAIYWRDQEIQDLKKRCNEALHEALGTVFCNMDEHGDPVGAQPESEWEKGYAVGLRNIYRVLKERGFKLPVASPTDTEESNGR